MGLRLCKGKNIIWDSNVRTKNISEVIFNYLSIELCVLRIWLTKHSWPRFLWHILSGYIWFYLMHIIWLLSLLILWSTRVWPAIAQLAINDLLMMSLDTADTKREKHNMRKSLTSVLGARWVLVCTSGNWLNVADNNYAVIAIK